MLSNKNLASAGSKNPVCDFHACDHFLYSARKSHGPKEKMYLFGKRDHSDLEETARQHICFCGMKWD